MTTNNEKQFDCLEMKKRIQAQVYAETQDMSTTELLSYFNRVSAGVSGTIGVYLREEDLSQRHGDTEDNLSLTFLPLNIKNT